MNKEDLTNMMNVMNDVLTPSHNLTRDVHLADWKYEKLKEQIQEFEKALDENHEIALKLASFGSSITMSVTSLDYQNPDILYFYGFVDGQKAQLIQHTNQLNFLLLAVEREDKSKPARRIGFKVSNDKK